MTTGSSMCLLRLVARHVKRRLVAPLLRQLGDRLRGYADAIDTPEVPKPPEMKLISRQELREVQQLGMRMISDWLHLSRSDGRDSGLLWIPTDVLQSILWFVGERSTCASATSRRSSTTRARAGDEALPGLREGPVAARSARADVLARAPP